MNAIQRLGAGGVLTAVLVSGVRVGAVEPSMNGPPPMANPYAYAFFDPARPSPQIVAPPKDWKLSALDGWNWCPNAFVVWPAFYGYGPWVSGWGFSWCPPYPYAPVNVYNLNIKIRF